jgi:hypothetical protein
MLGHILSASAEFEKVRLRHSSHSEGSSFGRMVLAIASLGRHREPPRAAQHIFAYAAGSFVSRVAGITR